MNRDCAPIELGTAAKFRGAAMYVVGMGIRLRNALRVKLQLPTLLPTDIRVARVISRADVIICSRLLISCKLYLVVCKLFSSSSLWYFIMGYPWQVKQAGDQQEVPQFQKTPELQP